MEKMREIMASRIRQARVSKGISQSELAAQIDISPSKVARLESGKFFISDEYLDLFASFFNLPHYFFFGSNSLSLSNLQSKLNKELTKLEFKQITAKIEITAEHFFSIVDIFEKYPLPTYKNQIFPAKSRKEEETIQDYAVKIKKFIGFSKNVDLISILEGYGIIYMEISDVTAKFNGLTTFIRQIPFIVVHPKSPIQQRITLIHEFGHLIGISDEKECDEFSKVFFDHHAKETCFLKSNLFFNLVCRAYKQKLIYDNEAASFLDMSKDDFLACVGGNQ